QPATSTYTHSDQLPINIAFADDTGVATSSALFDSMQVAASSSVDLFYQTLGNHTFTISAQDLVNNTTSTTRAIRVIATASSTQSDINRAYTLGWVSKDVKNLLLVQLNQAIKITKISNTIMVPGNPKKTQTVVTFLQTLDKIVLQTMAKELDVAKG